jgi:hypothetical protein
MTPRPIRQRLLFYAILAGLCCIVPFITTMILIMVTGDRELGMSIAVIPAVVIVHFIFSTVFLQTNPLVKFTIPILTAFLAIIGLKYILPLRIIHHLFDMYGFWDITITHLLTTIIIWEISYQALTKLVGQKV